MLIEFGPKSVEINPRVYVSLAEILEGDVMDISSLNGQKGFPRNC